MRLHDLEITAFGPFPETVRVDLDALADAGLFLLSGPTGAGKTSVLDAICFAIYGQVPGDRAAAKRLRCDTAPPEVAPRVVLEATVAGRRFRFTRSPAWHRPKKRGGGTTPAQAAVLVQERVDGAWLTLSTRQDEAGHLVGELLGLTLTQFTQVVLLPQGRFQAFLRADADERKALLERLFRTRRFADVEGWLRERRVRLRRQVDEHRREVDDLLSRISEAAHDPVPVDREDARAVDTAAGDGSLAAWARGWEVEADRRADAAARAAGAALAQQEAARRRLDEARARQERQARRAAALAEERALAAAEPLHRREVADLAAARRAAVVLPALRRQERTARDAARLDAHADAALATAAWEWRRAGQVLDGDALVAARDSALAAAAVVRAALPRRDALDDLAAALARAESTAAEADARHRAAVAGLGAVPARVGAARERLERATAAATTLVEVESEVTALASRREASLRLADLTARLETATAERVEVLGRVAEAQEVLVQLREARIEGMAAEIALGLAAGACCPVCGSAEHPAKAVAASGAPDATAERAAVKQLDDLRVHEVARADRVRELATLRELARTETGGPDAPPLHDMEAGLAVARGRAAELRAGAADLGAARDAVAAAEQDAVRAEAAVSRAAAELASSREGLARAAQQRYELTTELESLLAGTPAADLDQLLALRAGQARACEGALRALDDAAAATRASHEAGEEVDRMVAEAGFPGADAARRAHRDEADLAALADRVAAHERRTAVVRETLADPALADAGAPEGASPDLPALAAELEAAVDRLGGARAAEARWTRSRDRLAEHAAELAGRLAAWAPVREAHETTRALAAFVEGSAGDNAWRMRLSAYVLSYRLTQVVAAANERLSRMSDQRYALLHTGERGVGDPRGGLGLLVVDDWSGESRDPATLSGGETFVVSLALALGLADVITHEAGGAELDTLFVDEGFGSLDVDTLDDVLDTLDALRSGGRVVGVVSHVSEMRERIPARLEVSKGRAGSRLRVVPG